MDGAQLVAIVSVIVSPVTALVAVWLTANLSWRQRQRDQAAHERSAALESIGQYTALLMDATPKLVLNNDLREYETPEAAIIGLYARWDQVRRPFMTLSASHPSKEVRHLALELIVQLEQVLRRTDTVIKSGTANESGETAETERIYRGCSAMAERFGALIESGDRGRRSAARTP